ncbi:hypothetical protein QJS10_CPB17g01359 [Acorus calamus]|uniref:PUA domain-containing protein n=1 Tax=Acorus calamus TaxID=4465 RepID=A0AAV9CU00_ACOCL|nr:hypothetical protein QJS10_CPB17g01359 [Acorus calamus]
MRALDEKETTAVFEKLFKFIGPNLKHIVDRPDPDSPSAGGRHCFRLQRNHVYYAPESMVRRALHATRDRLDSLGVCVGRFTGSGSFRLTIQCLDLIAPFARRKIWLKPAAEMQFLYGNHVLKAGLGRITENTVMNDGVVVFSMSDLPLGFGVFVPKDTQACRKLEPNGMVLLNQGDIGEYLRMERVEDEPKNQDEERKVKKLKFNKKRKNPAMVGTRNGGFVGGRDVYKKRKTA